MMNKEQILKKIGKIIQELEEQHQYLTNAKKISLLELELFTANSDFLIDHIEILKKLDLNKDLEQKLIEPKEAVRLEEHYPKPDETKEAIANEVDGKGSEAIIEEKEEQTKKKMFDFSFDEEPAEMIFDFEKKIEVENVFDRVLSEDEKRVLEEKSKKEIIKPFENGGKDLEEEEIGEEPFLVEKSKEMSASEPEMFKEDTETTIDPVEEPIIKLADKVMDMPKETKPAEEKRLTLNEMLSAKLGKNMDGNGSTKQIADLKTAISLNDKMVFIKELFNGYNLAYSEAIEIINRFETFDAADNFLQKNYALKNDWSLKQTTVDRLYQYLDKKFVK
ncbi:hypothetical protein I5M32_05530 [Pedobacter sp. SD-b]|uniref:Uncharacterized protein n=1 Tax=Pedobacter segetis TaxID=2793069 RepID=A0ABS1BHQ4_9SPHI|nr:hypothetical protein [Pedobacter segetis]MBK0382417.1 hypothetical protein [Pedobacter segetis]